MHLVKYQMPQTVFRYPIKPHPDRPSRNHIFRACLFRGHISGSAVWKVSFLPIYLALNHNVKRMKIGTNSLAGGNCSRVRFYRNHRFDITSNIPSIGILLESHPENDERREVDSLI